MNADFVQATYTPGSGAIQTLLATGEVILRSGEDEAKADRAEYAAIDNPPTMGLLSDEYDVQIP